VAELIVQGSDLVLHLPVTQKILGFHGDIRVPLTSVQSVAAVDKPWLALRGRRMAGTALRGSTAIGTWIHGDREFDFCVLRHQLKAVQVDLNLGRFSRLLVCVPAGTDHKAEADRIADAAGIARNR
jgi:hypothetical protein